MRSSFEFYMLCGWSIYRSDCWGRFRDAVGVPCETKVEDWFNLRAAKGFLKSILRGVDRILHHIIQDEHAVRKNPRPRGYDSVEFVLNQTLAMTEAVTTAIFKLWYVQTQQLETVALENGWQHCVDFGQNRAAKFKWGYSPLVLQ